MNETNNFERKPELDLTILKAYAKQLHREIDSRSGYMGMKLSLGLIFRDLEVPSITIEKLNDIRAKLMTIERNLRERLAKEARERGEEDTPFDRIGKSMTGELEL